MSRNPNRNRCGLPVLRLWNRPQFVSGGKSGKSRIYGSESARIYTELGRKAKLTPRTAEPGLTERPWFRPPVQFLTILGCIVLTAVTLLIELPQGSGWIHSPRVLTLALPGVFLIRLATRPSRAELVLEAALAGCVFLASVPTCRGTFQVLLSGAASLGIGSFVGIGICWMREPRRLGAGRALAAAAMLLIFSITVPHFFRATVELAPRTYDGYLYAFECRWGTPISFLMGRLFAACPPLYAVAAVTYYLLPCVMAGFCALQIARSGETGPNVMIEFAIAAAAGWILYLQYPAVGPIFAFPADFPAALPAVRLDLAQPPIEAPRNCMPSLHTAWALLILWSSRPFRLWVKLLAGTVLLLTLLATLGLGQHYFVDLVVALPFALAVRAVCLPGIRRQRLMAIGVGSSLTAAWFVALKQKAFLTGVPMAALSGFLLLTVLAAARIEHRVSLLSGQDGSRSRP